MGYNMCPMIDLPQTKKEINDKKKGTLKLANLILSLDSDDDYHRLYHLTEAHHFLSSDIKLFEPHGKDKLFYKMKKKEEEIMCEIKEMIAKLHEESKT